MELISSKLALVQVGTIIRYRYTDNFIYIWYFHHFVTYGQTTYVPSSYNDYYYKRIKIGNNDNGSLSMDAVFKSC